MPDHSTAVRRLFLVPRGAERRVEDAALVRGAQGGSADAVEMLVRRYWDEAHRAAYLILGDAWAAEDVCQEALVAAVAAIGGFDRRRPFRPWLHRIVVNRAVDAARARARRAEAPAAETAAAASDEASEMSPPLSAALNELDPDDRAIVVLRHVLDFTSAEIGGMVGLPPATVRTRLRRALAQMRSRVGDERDQHRAGARARETPGGAADV